MTLQQTSYYDAHVQTLDLNDITSSDDNAEILRRLRDNDPKLPWLCIRQHVNADTDLGWLGYFIGRNTKLRSLYILDMPEYYREQIAALFRGIEQSRSIQKLSIEGDDLGESVLNSMSALLRSESCSLTSLELFSISFSDDVAVALADALKGNKSLTRLFFKSEALTLDGWSAFSKLLCDTSSVSNTYLSNHTLTYIGDRQVPHEVRQLLALNELADKHANAAIQKILKYRPDFDVRPFFRDKRKLKLLPLVMSWFERVRGISVLKANWFQRVIRGISEESEKAFFDTMQLTAMYKFVRSMPLEAIDGYRSHSSHKKRKFDFLGRNFHTLVLLCLLTLVLPLL